LDAEGNSSWHILQNRGMIWFECVDRGRTILFKLKVCFSLLFLLNCQIMKGNVNGVNASSGRWKRPDASSAKALDPPGM
jgi:hypothetical protein